MSKNKRVLSPREQRIYFTLSNSKNKIFTIDMIMSFRFCSYGTLRWLLSDMVKRGWLTRIKNGTYYLHGAGDSSIDDIFKISTHMYNGYVAFSSALYLYSALTERPYTVYVATRTTSKSSNLGGIEIKAVALGKRAVGATKYDEYQISTRAKTVYDSFHMPEYAGGYSKVIESVYNMRLTTAEWKEFIGYVNTFESDSSKRKIGYMLALANKVGNAVPKNVLNLLKNKGPVVKLGKGKNGKYIGEWGIVDYIGEGYLLGWSK